MNITPENVHELLASIGCKGDHEQKRGDWFRVYIHAPNDETGVPLSLGRVMFEHGAFKWVKWYSEPGSGDVQDFDRVWCAWHALTIANKTISDEAWALLKQSAHAEAREKFEGRRASRGMLNDVRKLQGKKPRGSRVAPPNPRASLRDLVCAWLSEETGRDVRLFAF